MVSNIPERRNWDVKHRFLSSVDKAEKILDYQPQTSFEEGVKKLHDWFDENWDFIQESAEFPEQLKNSWTIKRGD